MTKRKQSTLDRVISDFDYQTCPAGADPIRHHDRESVRSILGIAAQDMVRIAPECRELNHAINKLDEAVMWCHAAIDRYGERSQQGGA